MGAEPLCIAVKFLSSTRHNIITVPIYPVDCKDNVASGIDPSCSSPNCSCCLDSEQCLNGTCDGQCKIGYFGPGCNFPCPDSCIQCKNHNAASGTSPLFLDVANCTECIDGHYSTSDIFQCQHACPDPCHSCESDSICTLCKDGYFLEGTLCETCESSCATCASFIECRSCVLGFYLEGLVCKPCSSGCVSQCDKLSGTCSCKTRFRGDKCENCGNRRRYSRSCRSRDRSCYFTRILEKVIKVIPYSFTLYPRYRINKDGSCVHYKLSSVFPMKVNML